ncbi:hypothetical protein QU481_02305 [Crenobacter sp. SG2303]|uniref:DUF35 domain-containing protein n=1 Tax=Crenobacter oryzisoli TaxID=3056844 RepID=A0ABT7XIW1_9NEIS|nr:hypothetical protein [Crenobacter sp. SG2303]MDN0073726.1 hypothetical protein [Crenobacter sp. SG2303]
MIKHITGLKPRVGGIRYVCFERPSSLSPQPGDMAWVETEAGCHFCLCIEAIDNDGVLVGTVVSIRPVERLEVDGIRRHDRVSVPRDAVWQIVRTLAPRS